MCDILGTVTITNITKGFDQPEPDGYQATNPFGYPSALTMRASACNGVEVVGPVSALSHIVLQLNLTTCTRC